MHVAYIGNFEPEHSTENEVYRALINNDHVVSSYQEGSADALEFLINDIGLPVGRGSDFILWTRTKGLAAKVDPGLYWRMMQAADRAGIPVVGYHLDRWWGLARQSEITPFGDPFFRVNLLITADGGHDAEWEAAGVNHVWYPPAISERHCHLGTPREEYTSDIAFVGSWQGGYHPEDTHRPALIKWLQDNYSNRVKFWPEPGQHAIRGEALNDLYASVKVVVGTSCLAPKVDGSPMTHYCSDRIPETLGRGGVLVHPSVEGIDKLYGKFFPYELGDFESLHGVIEHVLRGYDDASRWHDDVEREFRQGASDFTRQHHTYELRIQNLIQLLNDKGYV